MALNFPNSPTNGQLYTDAMSGNSWTWDSANTCWKSTSTYIQTITVASSAPGTPGVGQLWWNQDYGRLLVYYNDGTNSQWVDASPSDYTSGLAYNQANAVSIVANLSYNQANAAFSLANTHLANTSNVTFRGNLYFPNGSVGIGTTLASYKLHVENAGYCEQLVFANSNGGQATYRLKSLNSNGSNNHILIGTGVTDNNQLVIRDEITNQVLYMISNTGLSSSFHKWYTNSNERMRIDASGYVTIPYQPSFLVTSGYAGGSGPAGPGVYVMTSVDHNVGSGYSTSTGRFTAPVAGRYMFLCAMLSRGSSPSYFNLRKNGSSIVQGEDSRSGGYGEANVTAVFNLSVGDYVDMYIAGSISAYGGAYDYFSGYLLG